MPAIIIALIAALIAQDDPIVASRKAIAGKTFRAVFSPGTATADVLMGGDGRLRIIRWAGAVEAGVVRGDGTSSRWTDVLTNVTEYTGRPARRCGDGTAPRGDLVIRYEHKQTTNAWTATTFALPRDQVGVSGVDQALAMLRGLERVANGEQREINGRLARELIAAWTPPSNARDPRSEPRLLRGDPLPNVKGDPAMNETIQSLWIDTVSKLPLRWEVTKRGIREQGFDFHYERIDLRPPAGVRPPDCVR